MLFLTLLQKGWWDGKPHYCKAFTLFLQTISKDFLFIYKANALKYRPVDSYCLRYITTKQEENLFSTYSPSNSKKSDTVSSPKCLLTYYQLDLAIQEIAVAHI